jgi:tetratricopeptide (TPR) repeat protein
MCAAFIAAVAITCVPRYEELLRFSLDFRSPLNSALTNLAALPITLSLAFRPWALSVEHAASFDIRTIAVGACLIVLIVTAALRTRERHPSITLALLWPLIALLPTHSFVAKLDSVTEGPLYLACIGPAIAAGSYGSRWLRHRSINIAIPTLMSISAAAVVLCAWRTLIWIDPVKLWEEATLQAPQSARPWINLGMAELNNADYAAARRAFHKAIDLDPTNTRAMLNLEVIAAIHPQEQRQ